MKSARRVVMIIAILLGLGWLIPSYLIGEHANTRSRLANAATDKQTINAELRTDGESLQRVDHLRFQLRDADGKELPTQSCQVRVQIHSSELDSFVDRKLVLDLDPAGVFAIPVPYPSQGRIRIWVDVDDPRLGAFTGYRNVAFQISNDSIQSERATNDFEMVACPVITGVVTDAATRLPVSNAEVAPVYLGHHAADAIWDKAVRTDAQGHYRILDRFHHGVAVRHSEYDEQKTRTEDTEVDFALDKLAACRIKIVDQKGNAIPNVRLPSGEVADSEGRGVVRYVPGSDRKVSISHTGFYRAEIRVNRLSESEEVVVEMKELPSIQGRVVDEFDRPLDNGKVEVLFGSSVVSDVYTEADGPRADGTWSLKSLRMDSRDAVGRIRVSVDGQVRLIQTFSSDDAKNGVIESRLPAGYQLRSKLLAKHPLDPKSTPVALLYRDGEYWSATIPGNSGQIEVAGLPNGNYTLGLEFPVKLTPRGMALTSMEQVMKDGPFLLDRFAFSTTFQIQDADVDLEDIDLDAQGLTPGSVVGQVFALPDKSTPLAAWYGYLCHERSNYNTIGYFDYYLEFQLDQQGRFRIDDLPPGKYMIRVSELPNSSAGEFFVTVSSGKTTEFEIFNSIQTKK